MSIEDKVKKIIAEKLSVDLSEVVPEAHFVDDLGADSLDLVELIMSMEGSSISIFPTKTRKSWPLLRMQSLTSTNTRNNLFPKIKQLAIGC